MSTLSYWYAKNRNDHDSYSLIGRTKSAVVQQITRHVKDGGRFDDYEEPKELHINYRDAFDLFEQATGEGGGRGVGDPT